MPLPVASVVIPSHRPGLRSAAEASYDAQTFPDREMVVRESPLWWPSKINRTIAAAEGEFYALLCDDDLLHPAFLERTVAKAREGFDLVWTDVRTFSAEGPGESPKLYGFSRDTFVRGLSPCWITTLVRKQLWQDVGGFDEGQSYYDLAFWYECFRAGARIAHVPEPLWSYRHSAQQGTHSVNRRDALGLFYAKYPELRAA